MGKKMRYPLNNILFTLPLVYLSLTSSSLFAQIPKGTQPGIGILSDQWIDYLPSTTTTVPINEVMSDRKQLLKELEKNTERFPIDKLTPNIALEFSKLFIQSKKPFAALDLLKSAQSKFPQDLEINHTYIRMLIHFGQASAARIEAQNALKQNNANAYTQYLYALSLYLEDDQKSLEASLAQVQDLLQKYPNFVGDDGTTADELKSFMNTLKERLNLK
jgi:hypothetical protein